MTRDPAALANLRHELRTPLNHIIGYSEMLLEDGEAGPAAKLGPGLRRILEEARRLLGMINELPRARAGRGGRGGPGAAARGAVRPAARDHRLRQRR